MNEQNSSVLSRLRYTALIPRLWPSQRSCRKRNSLHVFSVSSRFLACVVPSETPSPSALLQRSNASRSNTLNRPQFCDRSVASTSLYTNNNILIARTIFTVLCIRRQPYARVNFGSSGRKSVSARWPPTRRPGCKLD